MVNEGTGCRENAVSRRGRLEHPANKMIQFDATIGAQSEKPSRTVIVPMVSPMSAGMRGATLSRKNADWVVGVGKHSSRRDAGAKTKTFWYSPPSLQAKC